jgi:hypothetical protein
VGGWAEAEGWRVGGRCAWVEAGASVSQHGGWAACGGHTGRERRRQARGSWRHGSESSERERGMGRAAFFWIRQ